MVSVDVKHRVYLLTWPSPWQQARQDGDVLSRQRRGTVQVVTPRLASSVVVDTGKAESSRLAPSVYNRGFLAVDIRKDESSTLASSMKGTIAKKGHWEG